MVSGLSKRVLVIVLIIWSYAFVKYERWKDFHLIQWDTLEYYAFLPQVFIEHDLSYKFLKDKRGTHWDNLYLKTLPDGIVLNKRTIGMALCELPFFLVGHWVAGMSGYEQDGFSFPYQLALAISGVLYAFIGFIFLRKTLLRYFSEIVTTITLILLLLGTNLWSGTLLEIGLTHPYSFMFFAAFFYITIKWLERPAYKYVMALGISAGMIILLRPTNSIILLVPLLFGINSIADLKTRFIFFWKYKLHLLLFILCFFAVLIPQMSYWKYSTGHWVLYSYGKERFYFLKPHILSGLFSYRKGWLLYTPIMIFVLAGIFMLRKYAKEFFWPILIFTLLNIWIVLSWWCWWYGGSFGMRAFIESYAILVFPLAAFVHFSWEKRKWVFKLSFILIFSFFIYLNLFQSYQYKASLLHWQCTSKQLFFSIWGTNNWPENYHQILICPDFEEGGWEEESSIEKFPF